MLGLEIRNRSPSAPFEPDQYGGLMTSTAFIFSVSIATGDTIWGVTLWRAGRIVVWLVMRLKE